MSVNKEKVSTEVADTSDSGVQTALMLTDDSNVIESKIMEEVEIHSTQIPMSQNKKSDDSDMLTRLYSMMCSMKERSEEQKTMLDVTFNEVKSRFDINDHKFDVQNLIN